MGPYKKKHILPLWITYVFYYEQFKESSPCCNSTWLYFDGLVQERRNSIANALELHLSCTNPMICW